MRRFDRESVTIARLSHPNIVHVIDRGKIDDQYYFVMEYVKSLGLAPAMPHRGVSLNRAYDIFIQIAKTLAYAHKNGVIHRDIKPDNILVDYEGDTAINLGVYGAPETFLIDSKGTIVYKISGVLTQENIQQALLPLIAQITP